MKSNLLNTILYTAIEINELQIFIYTKIVTKKKKVPLSHLQSWFLNCFFLKEIVIIVQCKTTLTMTTTKKILRVCLLSVNFYFHLFFLSSFNSSSFVVFSFILFYHFWIVKKNSFSSGRMNEWSMSVFTFFCFLLSLNSDTDLLFSFISFFLLFIYFHSILFFLHPFLSSFYFN